MRVARDLERETGMKIIHFEKGDYQGPDFVTPQHVLDATAQALRDGYVRYDPGPGLPGKKRKAYVTGRSYCYGWGKTLFNHEPADIS
jgi:aspartate/methionine/tyrosine aminotransferase